MSVKTLQFTVFTDAINTILVYSATEWVTVSMGLQSAGTVIVGANQPNLFPIGSGKGRTLPAGRDLVTVLAPSDRIYIASDSPQSVGVTIAGVPETTFLQALIEATRNPTLTTPVDGKPPVWPFRF